MSNSYAFNCVKLTVGLGIIALVLWLSLRTTKPKCSIEDFYVAGLDKSVNATRRNENLSFQLNLKNEMKDKAVRYDDITLSFYYNSTIIGNYTVPGFKQGKDKEAHKSGMIETHNMPWEAALKAVSNNNGSKASFRVDVSSKVRYKITFWYTKRHNYFEENEVQVDNTGRSGAQQLAYSSCLAFFLFSLLLPLLY